MNFKSRYNSKFVAKTPDTLERTLVDQIRRTGKIQIQKRRKAGLSVYFVRDGRLVEQKSDKTEIKGKAIKSRWISLDKANRTVTLK